jgi:hypothetical protein
LARIEGTVRAPEVRNTVNSLDFDMGFGCKTTPGWTTRHKRGYVGDSSGRLISELEWTPAC